MIRGLYTAASGMVSTMRQLEVVIHNIANAQTTGFKQERVAGVSFDDQLVYQQAAMAGPPLGQLGLAAVAEQPGLDLSQGPLQATGRSLDLALEGPGFFVIQTADGPAYTRDGSFVRDVDGNLVTQDGAPVMGENGPIQVLDGRLAFGPDGSVLVDDQPVDRLLIVDFEAGVTLRRIGNNLFVPRDPAVQPGPAAAVTVRQGYVEGSNVDLTGAMTTMLELQRAYEASQRMIQEQDAMTARAVNDIARPA